MRLETISEFVVLAETMNYTKTASRLNITQSTLSKHMTELEKETGLELFNHSVSTPSLTEVGSLFLQRFSVIDAQISSSLEECRRLQALPNLSIKVHSAQLSVVCDPIRRSLRCFSADNPGCSISFVNIPPVDSVQDALSEGLVDVAFDSTPVAYSPDKYIEEMSNRGFEAYEFASEPIVVWLRKDHPLATRRSVSFSDIKDYPIITSSGCRLDSIRELIIRIFREEDAQPRFRRFYFDPANDNRSTYFSLTEFEDSLMFTTSGMVESGPLASRPDVLCKIPDDPKMNIRIFILVRQSDELALKFLEFCKTLS